MAVTIPESNHCHKSKETGSNPASIAGPVIIGLLLLGYLWLSGTAGAAAAAQPERTLVEQADYWK